ncbi:hypothetical protein C2845_PM09G06250 [Panicum miliaceum]|uniref:At1g61320/AtMIF1 LRR domain-containing protein n=1 Tax=Panicum miliaceum TaxID=4540 RepID=A0A3L6S243_PANMI|nr:hypothetical protein C2845_PM09G06250 [Panicum miliaceum]
MKNLALDLAPAEFVGVNVREKKFVNVKDRYMFPIELFDSASISQIRHIQLSCVSFRPPSPFRGFPNLRKLDLYLFDASEMDLDEMLSGCSNLEWLSFYKCDVNDELKVKQPLYRLLYLRIAHCNITKVVLCAENLKTFVYHGGRLPIDLGQVKQLETAKLRLYGITFEYVLNELPDFLRGVQNLTFQTSYLPLVFSVFQKPLLLENIGSFPQLRFLRLTLLVRYCDNENILSLASFLKAAPLIEELEMHLSKESAFTGFNGIKGQREFLLHIVENAPAMKVLTIDPKKRLGLCNGKPADFFACRASVRRELKGKLSPGAEVNIL